MFWTNVLKFLDTEMTEPASYGPFHLFFFALSIVVGVLLCLIVKNHKKHAPRIVFTAAVIVAVLEVYKMINFGFSYEDGISYSFPWGSFPFQFCSTPMYVGLLVGLFRKGRIHNALCAYLATYAVFAGLCVMIYPNDVFIETIGINIQTMICHGSMIVLGVYLFYSGHVKANLGTLLKAIPVFAVCVGLAAVMNEIAYISGLLERETFNMFFISPHCDPSLPVYSTVQKLLPFPWCLLVYILAFTAASGIILLVTMGISRLADRKRIPV